jgi:acetolactate synthase-1/2/3 large subunit
MINNYLLIETLSTLSTKDDIVSTGSSGTNACRLYQSWKVTYGQRFPSALAIGAMGAGLPIAIGACLVNRHRVIYVGGDGCFQLNIQELEVVRREQLPMKLFILNNGGYGSIINTQNKYFEGRHIGAGKPDLTLPPLEKIAAVYDMKYFIIKEDAEITKVCKQALSDNLPCIIEVMEDTDQKTLMRVETKIVNGVPVSGKFEEV